ncbi:hypothetical protein H6F70_22115 [Coleofasciculus sp. FACHB-T130]|nr:hypothetical protein [Coleofasciculus sp. FACHB-T130]
MSETDHRSSRLSDVEEEILKISTESDGVHHKPHYRSFVTLGRGKMEIGWLKSCGNSTPEPIHKSN